MPTSNIKQLRLSARNSLGVKQVLKEGKRQDLLG